RHAFSPAGQCRGQDAAHRLDLAVERQLPDDGEWCRAFLDDPGRREDAERDRQVEGRALLTEVGRGEVDRHAVVRAYVATVADRGPHALAALPHRGIR